MRALKGVLISLGIMVAGGGGLLAVSALVVSKTGALPRGSLLLLTTILTALASFAGGLFLSLLFKEKGLLLGLLCGAVLSLGIALVSVLAYGNDFTAASVAKLLAILTAGAIGGILGVNRRKKIKF